MAGAPIAFVLLGLLLLSYCMAHISAGSEARAASVARWGSFAVAVLQNSFGVLILRYDRLHCGEATPSSIVVLDRELVKLVVCLLTLLVEHCGPLRRFQALHASLCEDKLTLLKLGVPATSYAIQNTLQLLAAQYLGAVLLHMLKCTKILVTVVMGVLILGCVVTQLQWFALMLIVGGVILTQKAHGHETTLKSMPEQVTIGMCAALTVAVLSSIASVYLEKIIKGDCVSLPVRNVQLCLYLIPLQLLHIASNGDYYCMLLSNLCTSSWVLIFNLAFAGLLVAFMLRYTDNNLKSIAQALATVQSSIIAVPMFSFEPDVQFVVSMLIVVGAALMYTVPPDFAEQCMSQ